MDDQQRADDAGVNSVFPGEVILLRNGRKIVVAPWDAWYGSKEAPARVAAIINIIMPAVMGGGDAEMIRSRIAVAITAGMDAVVEMLRDLYSLTEVDLRTMSMGELTRVARIMVEQNMDFFEEAVKLYALVARQPLVGGTSRRS